MSLPASSRPAAGEKPGRHRVQRGFRMPGFGRVLATREEFTAETILRRNNRRVVTEHEDGGQDR